MVIRRRDQNNPSVIDGSDQEPIDLPQQPRVKSTEALARRHGVTIEDRSAEPPPPLPEGGSPVMQAALRTVMLAEKRGIEVQDFSSDAKTPAAAAPETDPAPAKPQHALKRRIPDVPLIDHTVQQAMPQPDLTKAEKLVEFVHIPNKLKKKVGEGASTFEPGMFLKAQEAVKHLASNYIDGIVPKEMRDLNNSIQSLNHFPERANEYISKVFNQAHEIKSGGGSYGYPLISRIADSLGKLTEGMRQPEAMDLALIKFHQDALNIVVRKKIKGIGGEIGQLLVEGLEVVVAKHKAHDPSLVIENINQFLEKLDM
jgi:hypothetical protein